MPESFIIENKELINSIINKLNIQVSKAANLQGALQGELEEIITSAHKQQTNEMIDEA